MATDVSRVIVTPGAVSKGVQVQHRDYPEIRASGPTPEAAATHLLNELTRALDSALTSWRREAIERAIADVRAFVEGPS